MSIASASNKDVEIQELNVKLQRKQVMREGD
jgi:hypothetical protein